MRTLSRRALLSATAVSALAGAPSKNLIGYWTLATDARDSSGNGLHGEARAVTFSDGSARFDGRSSMIEIVDHPKLRLGTHDFTIAARVYTERNLDDVAGDIVSQYDPASRRGFNFNIKSNPVVFSQSNIRQLQFGIDQGRIGEWIDCGRPGNNIYVMALAVFNGELYAGTCEPGKDDAGHIYRYAGGTKWVDCGSPDTSNSISVLVEFDGNLYAGTARYNLSGSSLPSSPNERPGGRVYRYEGGTKWAPCGKLGESAAVSGMAVYQGKLHASSLYAPAGTFRYEGGERWVSTGTPEGRRVEAMAVFNGALWGTGYDKGEIYRYDGKSWVIVGSLPETTQTYGFAVYEGKLYVSTWPSASAYRYDGDHNWTHCGKLGDEKEVMGMAVYNGKMYAGTLPLAEVHRYESGKTWTRTGQLDRTPDVRYRRAWSMAVFRGKLFCGTLPSGRVFALEAGKSVTQDRMIEPGWRHVAAVRARGKLRLFVDGKQVAESDAFGPRDYDLSSGRPLRIGFGDNDYFNGMMRDVRLYGRALEPREIAALAR